MTKPLWFRPVVIYSAWFALFMLIFFQSWVSEDAYITFRVIDNFLAGHGLRWNIYERVQIYTHPLWLLLHLPFAMLWKNLFHLNIALSLACSSLAVAVVLLTFRKSLGVTLVGFMLPLFLSKCFIDYSGSGLETSLSFLLFSLIGYTIVHWHHRRWFLLVLSLISSLLLLNRLDHAVLLAPIWIYAMERDRALVKSWRGFAMLAVGTLPLVSWFAFSLLYYGFLFPNTKYAKLDTGIPLTEYLWQGMQYTFIFATQDTLSFLIVGASLLLTLNNKRRPMLYKALAIGIIFNIAYTLYIGGDYMMGRFYAFIFFTSAWLLFAVLPERIRPDILFAIALTLIVAFSISYAVRDIRKSCEECVPVRGRVLDARHIFSANALFTYRWPYRMRQDGEYKFKQDGKKMAAEKMPPVRPLYFVGMQAYYAGSRATFIDELALGDALLARLPANKTRSFYVGHFRRTLPKGYLKAVQFGAYDDMNPNLLKYYEKLKLITQGNLWDKERLKTILYFNMGYYDHYKLGYLQSAR